MMDREISALQSDIGLDELLNENKKIIDDLIYAS